MPPSVAHLHTLLARNAKIVKAAWKQASRLVETHLGASTRAAQTELQPIVVRNAARHPVHPLAALKQSKGRWYSTHSAIGSFVRRFTTQAKAVSRYDRASFPKSRIGSAVNASSGRAPFATTLRPNLTGGTLGRSAGGYGFGGGSARYFSHGPTAPAQVVQNVSQAVRAFLISGQKVQFNGVDPITGEKRYKAITPLQDNVNRKVNKLPKATPGSFIDFKINPTITALTPLSAIAGFAPAHGPDNLNTDGLKDVLATDFSRSLKELSAVLNDLNRLSALGDLPISYQGTSLRVHFPGCDAETVLNLCDEMGISRGIITQDEEFDAFVGTDIALLFPFAPDGTASECSFYEKPIDHRGYAQDKVQWQTMLTPERQSAVEYSTKSDTGEDFEDIAGENPWLSSPSEFDSLYASDMSESMISDHAFDKHTPLEYQGFEGIYRFMEHCESASSWR
ncbi:hypothetical protein EJ05DRAFT_472841 [Pseudovirgaria hyperparasitica]|uniref:Casein kinase II beta 2 subunit n=1 Tax=Pseudovirgaria hyperparasitica TaxID=470096 RepID=A0A6A6WIE6_9PEZI|nr:uncharacterized protein EJ05DRAFT_472841 [Pseudovirgaria hyperparasitica]KAF2761885.1 hypothetical protein EJ05DRAFT_472841 [Pseudovirgaria hyperparasitica]